MLSLSTKIDLDRWVDHMVTIGGNPEPDTALHDGLRKYRGLFVVPEIGGTALIGIVLSGVCVCARVAPWVAKEITE